MQLLEPLYKMDLTKIAKKISVPVRAVSSDFGATAMDVNRQYLSDYDYREVKGTGHYPMLEDPAAFNAALFECLQG